MLKKTKILAMLAGAYFALNASAAEEVKKELKMFDYDALHKQELKAILQPVRPGIPGKRPFWNNFAKRFIYAPAFDFKKVEGAVKYRFTVLDKDKSYSFEAKEPWAPLTPIWGKIPDGNVMVRRNGKGTLKLKVEGISQDGTVVGLAGERSLEKSPCFKGPYKTSNMTYEESAEKGLRAVFELGHVQQWLKTGTPDPNEPLYGYPAKIMGALMHGLVVFANDYAKNADEAEMAIKIARMNADYIIKLSDPPGSPTDALQDFMPLTYWDGKDPDTDKMLMKRVLYPYKRYILRLDPAGFDTGFGLCALYERTKDKKYLEYARRLGETYVKLQGEDGTWDMEFDIKRGRPTKASSKSRLIPTMIMRFLDHLIKKYDMTQFKASRDKAIAWMFANTIKTYNWQPQFEDTKFFDAYRNHSSVDVILFASLLMDHTSENPEYLAYAEECMRFAEDQFIVWSKKGFGAMIGPGVLEKYTFQHLEPAIGFLACEAYLKLYKVTGKKIFLAKAVALIDGAVSGQKFMHEKHGSWLIMTRNGHYINPQREWVNCNVYGAMGIAEIDKALKAIRNGDKEWTSERKSSGN